MPPKTQAYFMERLQRSYNVYMEADPSRSPTCVLVSPEMVKRYHVDDSFVNRSHWNGLQVMLDSNVRGIKFV